jgi:hypothetical protein
MNSRLIIAAEDINSSPVLLKRFRGKIPKEVYLFGKGIFLTGSVSKPVPVTALQIPGELTKDFVYTAVGQIGEGVIGYISGVGFVRYLYKIVWPAKLKATARLAYNVACRPLTLHSKEIGEAFDLLRLSKLEDMWFDEPVYIFDDNRFC